MSATAEAIVKPVFDIEAVRRDFPILARQVHGKPLVFLDSAASAQKPVQVMDAERHIYEHEYANVHRGIHYLSQVCTDRMEAARETVRAFLNEAVEELRDDALADAFRARIEGWVEARYENEGEKVA